MAEAKAEGEAWQTWFGAQGISPLRLSYEALAADPAASVAAVMDHLGVEPAEAIKAAPQTSALADDISQDWVARFRRGDTS